MSEGELTLRKDVQGRISVIHVVGELDLATVGVLDAELEQPSGGDQVVVLAECTFIDSSALRTLVRAHHAAEEHGTRFLIAAPTQPARRVLEVASLDHMIPVFDSVAEAVDSATAPPV